MRGLNALNRASLKVEQSSPSCDVALSLVQLGEQVEAGDC